jgi:DNA-binding NarL/FixJ family response regulator
MHSVTSPSLRRAPLVYIAYPEPQCSRALHDAFLMSGFEVSLVDDAGAVVRLSAIRRPDLVLIPLCGIDGGIDAAIGTIEAIRSLHLAIQVYVLAPDNARAELVTEAIKAGAAYAFSPPHTSTHIMRAAEELLGGDMVVAGEGDAAIAAGFAMLTRREKQVLKFVIEGRTNKEIGPQMGISYRTVEVYRRSLLSKTGARNTAELVRLAIES